LPASNSRNRNLGTRRGAILSFIETFEPDRPAGQVFAFHFTPAEWRLIIEDPLFLAGVGNSYRPRRFLGLTVRIVPDHQFG